MVPEHLVMQAFGPFSEQESVDFTALQQTPLFLINGPTGAGKSTLLDAICFALYGQTTGNEREGVQMRSDYAADTMETEVVFEFSLRSICYRVRRLPMQWRPKSRGKGMRQVPAEAQMWMREGHQWQLLAKNIQDVNDTVIQLLGLSAAQFRQVMVLPQGKFREFLLADSRARETILATLFKTEVYQRIEQILKDEASEIRQSVAEYEIQKRTLFENVGVVDDAQFQVLFEQTREAAKQIQQQREQQLGRVQQAQKRLEVAQRISDKQQQLEAARQRLAQLHAEREGIEHDRQKLQCFRRAQDLQPHWNAVQHSAERAEKNRTEQTRIRSQGPALEDLVRQRQAACHQAEEAFEQLGPKRDALQRWRQYRLDWQAWADTDKVSADCKQQLEQAQQALLILQSQRAQASADSEQLAAQLKACEQAQPALVEAKEQWRLADSKVQQALKMATLHRLYTEQKAQLEQQESGLARAVEQFERAEQDYMRLQFNWHHQQAAILAQQLQPGKPCPVCGSCEHPAPRQAEADAVSEQQLESQKKTVDARRGERERSWRSCEQARQAVKTSVDRLEELEVLCGPWRVSQLQEAEQACNEREAQVAELQHRVDQKATFEQKVDDAKNAEKTLLGREQAALIEKEKLAQKAETLASNAAQMRAKLPAEIETDVQIEERIGQLQIELDERQDQRDQARLALNESLQQQGQLQAKLVLLEEQYSDIEQEQRTAAQAFETVLEKSSFAGRDAFLAALESTATIAELDARIQSFDKSWHQQTAIINALKSELGDALVPNLDDLQVTLAEHQHTLAEIEQVYLSAQSEADQSAQTRQRLLSLRQRYKTLQERYEVVGSLAEVASGQNPMKVSLQRFVLSVILDDVLLQASIRLRLMSLGRYQLQRKEDRSKGNRASGLDIEVYDEYSGRSRSVATLSGGESFLAALALALGLADVVQAQAGGIQLETLFIDEGFGSLDAEALDQALRVLMDLHGQGRMIGIISHVQELKEQVPTRLDVVPSRSGSCVLLRC